jgi:hypothetical protein
VGRDASDRRPSPALTAALLGLTAAAIGAAVAFGLLAGGSGGSESPASSISISTSISPREHFFGDRVSAVVAVRVQRDLVDPRTVSIHARFAPYTSLGRPVLTRSGDSVVLRAELVCLAAACAPKAPQRQESLPSVRIGFRAGTRARVATAPWPPELVASRLTPGDLQRPALRARLQPPPAPTGSSLLGWGLIGAATLLLVLATLPLLGRLLALPAATSGAGPDDLGLALGEVERLAAATDLDRRVAIERLARALARAGLHDVTPRARALAWSRRPPGSDSIRHLLDAIERRTRRVA